MADGIGNVEIWRARPEEADAAYCLVREYFEVAGVMVREDLEKFVEEYFADGQGLWLARAAEQLAGCVGLRRLPGPQELGPEDVQCAEIKRMYVREKYRGLGIAARLLEAVENFAFAKARKCILREERNFVRLVPGTFNLSKAAAG